MAHRQTALTIHAHGPPIRHGCAHSKDCGDRRTAPPRQISVDTRVPVSRLALRAFPDVLPRACRQLSAVRLCHADGWNGFHACCGFSLSLLIEVYRIARKGCHKGPQDDCARSPCIPQPRRARPPFPVLADTSKEGRSASILLACLANIGEFGRSLLETVGQRAGARTRIDAYTEICFPGQDDKRLRPDGLIVLTTGSRQWRALVEAKIGNAELEAAQVEAYLDLARDREIDALITISNQFAAVPAVHPLQLSSSARRKIELFHWSWMHVLTEASLLLANDEIQDVDQRFVLNEMVRFLTHPSTGVKGFDQMPASWTDLVNSVQAGAAPSATSMEARETIGAWHQVVRDLSLTMSRQLAVEVSPKIPREHLRDLDARAKADASKLCEDRCLTATLAVPDAAAPIDVCADIRARSLLISMRLRAPEERKGSKARINWLLRQLNPPSLENWYVRLHWPGRAAYTQKPLSSLKELPDQAADERPDLVVYAFEVVLVQDIAGRFAQRKNFITELGTVVPQFYERVGQHLKAWQPSAPKLPEAKAEPSSVNTEALRDAAEQEAVASQLPERPPSS